MASAGFSLWALLRNIQTQKELESIQVASEERQEAMAKIINLSDLLEGCLQVLLSVTRVKQVFYWKNPSMGEKRGMRFFFHRKSLFHQSKLLAERGKASERW